MEVSSTNKNPFAQQIGFAFLMCLTLGLAPFSPEPHIVGKIRWILGGADGMQLMDYGDLLMHGAPFIFLIYTLFRFLTFKKK